MRYAQHDHACRINMCKVALVRQPTQASERTWAALCRQFRYSINFAFWIQQGTRQGGVSEKLTESTATLAFMLHPFLTQKAYVAKAMHAAWLRRRADLGRQYSIQPHVLLCRRHCARQYECVYEQAAHLAKVEVFLNQLLHRKRESPSAHARKRKAKHNAEIGTLDSQTF